MNNETFAFLYSTRFYSLLIGALSVYLQSKGILGEAEMLFIATITAGFTIIRTLDRATEQKIIAAAVEAGKVEVAKVLPAIKDKLE